MTPLRHFIEVWERCSHLTAMQAYLAANVVAALKPDELLRAEWVARVSALDQYVHELVAQRMVAVFEGRLPATLAYKAFMVSCEALDRIRNAGSPIDASLAFDFEVRRQLGFVTYQYPDKIADGLRMCSGTELWNAVALHQGATQQTKVAVAKQIKQQLTVIVDRRNKIAHEGDLQPKAIPILPWPVSQADLNTVSTFIGGLVQSIDDCV